MEKSKATQAVLDRMLIEGRELTEKLEKLLSFIGSDKFEALDETTRAMLHAQASLMHQYQNVLNNRYTKMESGEGNFTGLTFGVAITMLEKGFVLKRAGWNGKNIVVFKQVPATIGKETIPNMKSLPETAKRVILNGKEHIDYTSQCLIYNRATGRADSWVPSISDTFANDWEVVDTDKLCNEDSQKVSLRDVAQPFMNYLKESYHPHCSAIVTSTTAEILEGTEVYYEESK